MSVQNCISKTVAWIEFHETYENVDLDQSGGAQIDLVEITDIRLELSALE